MSTQQDEDGASGLVLVIDDDDNVRSLLERQIRRLGHEVIQAADGLAGLSMAVSRQPQLILVDLRMPGIDGHTFVRRLAASGTSASVVAMSGQGNMDDVIDVLRAGVTDYLRKPWSVAELAGAIERAFEKQRRERPASAEPAPAPASNEPLSQVLTRLRSGELPIPPMPALINSLRSAVRRATADLDEVAGLIEQDQRIAADVLRLSNTAHYARGGRIHSIKMAVSRIGFRQLHNLVETIFLRDFFPSRDPEVSQFLGQIWKRSIAHATAMRELAAMAIGKTGRLNGDTAYLIGLMADVGASLLLWLAEERKKSGSWVGAAAYLPAIQSSHQEVGAALLGQWMADPTVLAAISDHHGQGEQPAEYGRLMVVAREAVKGLPGVPNDLTAPPGSGQTSVVDRCIVELRIDRLRLPQVIQEIAQRYKETVDACK